MLKLKKIPKEDLKKVWDIHKLYVDEKSKFKEIEELYLKLSKLFVGAYKNNKLIGICFPGILNGEIFIKSIAVKYRYWRKGIGTKLLKLFEEQAKKLKIKRITVAAADIDWVENFYLKNGYRPIEILVKIKKIPRTYKTKFRILRERIEKNYKILYIRARRYNPKQKEKIKKFFNSIEVLWIMEKKL